MKGFPSIACFFQRNVLSIKKYIRAIFILLLKLNYKENMKKIKCGTMMIRIFILICIEELLKTILIMSGIVINKV